MHCRSQCSEIESYSCHPEFFFPLKIEETYTFKNRNFKRQKFHVRKVKCLVRATERKMSVWRMETSDNRSYHLLKGLLDICNYVYVCWERWFSSQWHSQLTRINTNTPNSSWTYDLSSGYLCRCSTNELQDTGGS